jgi:hypothetical protein
MKRSMIAAKAEREKAVQDAISEVASLYLEAEEEATSKQNNVARGTLTRLINAAEEKYQLEAGDVKVHTVLSLIRRRNPTGMRTSSTSPMAAMYHTWLVTVSGWPELDGPSTRRKYWHWRAHLSLKLRWKKSTLNGSTNTESTGTTRLNLF